MQFSQGHFPPGALSWNVFSWFMIYDSNRLNRRIWNKNKQVCMYLFQILRFSLFESVGFELHKLGWCFWGAFDVCLICFLGAFDLTFCARKTSHSVLTKPHILCSQNLTFCVHKTSHSALTKPHILCSQNLTFCAHKTSHSVFTKPHILCLQNLTFCAHKTSHSVLTKPFILCSQNLTFCVLET